MLVAKARYLCGRMRNRESISAGLSRLFSQRIVFLPCGQFHGWSIVPICRTMLVIWLLFRTFPTITLDLHASMANSLRVLEGRLDRRRSVQRAKEKTVNGNVHHARACVLAKEEQQFFQICQRLVSKITSPVLGQCTLHSEFSLLCCF